MPARIWLRALFLLACLVVFGVTAGVGLALNQPTWLVVVIAVAIETGFVISVLRDPLIRRQLR